MILSVFAGLPQQGSLLECSRCILCPCDTVGRSCFVTLCVDEGVKVTSDSHLSGGSDMRTTVAIRNSPPPGLHPALRGRVRRS